MKKLFLSLVAITIFAGFIASCEPARKSQDPSNPMSTDSTNNSGSTTLPDSTQRN